MDTPTLRGLDLLGDQIAELSAHLDAATARLLDLIREFDARRGWNTGFPSCAHWLSWRVGLDLGAARERVRVARALGMLPRLAGAMARGELSYSKVRALTRVATPETEERLLSVGRAGATEHVERIVRGWRRVDYLAEAKQAEQQHRTRALHLVTADDGMVLIRGCLTPEAGALLRRALEAACEVLYHQRHRELAHATGERALEPPSPTQQRADALVLMAESALHSGLDPGTPGERYHVVVHVDAEALAETQDGETRGGHSVLEEGAHVSAETSRRLTCDASRNFIRHDSAGKILEVERRTRTISPALRRALQARDRGCRFPGCGVRVAQGHHLRHWAHGGPTTLSNLALLCRRHHRSVHEEGYTVERLADESLRFLRPDGQEVPDVPAPAPVPPDPMDALRDENARRGLEIDSRSGLPSWTGERLDLVYALDVLHPLARQSALPTAARSEQLTPRRPPA